MNLKVKMKPDLRHCRVCIDMAESCGSIPPCEKCEMKSGTWVDTIKSIFETQAVVVLENGEVVNVPIDRITVEDIVKGAVKE